MDKRPERLISADKLLEWMSGISVGFTDKFEQQLKEKITVGYFDPDSMDLEVQA